MRRIYKAKMLSVVMLIAFTVLNSFPITPITQAQSPSTVLLASPTIPGDINLDATVDIYDAIHMTVYFGVNYKVLSRLEGYPKFPEYKIVMRACTIHTTELDEANIDDAAYITYNFGKTAA